MKGSSRHRKGDRVFEDVHPKCGVELLHLLQRLQEWGNVKVVVVLQPVAEGFHTTLLEDALTVLVLLGREYVSPFQLGVPSKVWWKPGVIQLVWAVEPLVQEPGLGKRGTVSLDPLVVSDARGQVVHYIQELELGVLMNIMRPFFSAAKMPLACVITGIKYLRMSLRS